MIENNFFSLITKLSFYLCPDNQFDDLVEYFKSTVHKFCNFDNEQLYGIQAFIERLDDNSFVEIHLRKLVKEMGKDFTDSQKYIVLFRALFVSHYDSDISRKIGQMIEWFGYDETTLANIKKQVDLVVTAVEIEKEKSIFAFFNLPEELDTYIISNAFAFDNYFAGDAKLLTGLKASDFVHEFDKDALAAVKALDGITNLMTEPLFDLNLKMSIIQMTGSSIRVTKDNYPELHELFIKCCKVLNMKNVPQLYIQQGFINASTSGRGDEFFISIASGCIGLLSKQELMFIIGHELGHIKSDHTYYNFVATSFTNLVGKVPIFGTAAKLPLLKWSRMAEFTADRAGLLCCQNIDAAISIFMKMSGVPIKYYNKLDTRTFLNQAAEFKQINSSSIFQKGAELYLILDETHPWTILRAAHLKEWGDSVAYSRIIETYGERTNKMLTL